MKKFLRSVMTLGLAVGLLSGCKGTTPVEKHTVFFWMGPTESLYKEVEVEHGKKVEKPTDPTKEGFTFIDWYADKALATKFDFDKAVEEDLDVYAKWSRDYVPSDKVLSIVGELKNSDIDWVSWPVDATNPDHYDERSFLTKADDSNVFSITLEIGYNGAFKINEPGIAWDAGVQFEWQHVRQVKEGTEVPAYMAEQGLRNIQIKDCGKYLLEADIDELVLDVTRLGDVDEGSGAEPNLEGQPQWGLVGGHNDWGNPDGNGDVIADTPFTFNEDGFYHHLDLVWLEADTQFKLRTGNTWGEEHAYTETDILDENIEEALDEGGNPSGNYKVVKSGLYQFVYVPEGDSGAAVLHARLAKFALRGDVEGFLTWGEDAQFFEVNETGLVYSKTVTFPAAGEYKVKLAALGPHPGWNVAFSTEEGGANMTCAADETVTLTLTFTVTEGVVEGVLVKA